MRKFIKPTRAKGNLLKISKFISSKIENAVMRNDKNATVIRNRRNNPILWVES